MSKHSVTFILLLVLLLGSVLNARAKTVSLAWDPSPDTQVAGYRLYYATGSTADPYAGTGTDLGPSPVDVGSATTATLSGLADSATHYFKVTAYDANGTESDYSNQVTSPPVQVPVNHAPTLSSPGNRTLAEGSSLAFTLNGADSDGDALSYSASGVPVGATFNSVSRSFSWTPGYDQAGSYSVTFRVSDGALSASQTIIITVSNVNRAPQFSVIPAQTVAENAPLGFTLSASDPDGDSLTFSAANLPGGSQLSNFSHSFSWTPGYDQAGSYAVTFSVSDGNLGASQTVTITVSNVNRAPQFSPVPTQSVAENAQLSFTLSASDPDGDSLSYSASGLPAGASFSGTSRTFSWTPGFDQAGSYPVVFTVSDGSLTASRTVTINVSNLNRAPQLSPVPTQAVAENAPLSFTLSGSDPDGDSLSYSASGLPAGASFSGASRSFSWTPDFDQAGSYPVTFTVSDGSLTASRTVQITVSNVNRKPVISGTPAFSVMVGQSYRFTPTAQDPDGQPLTFNISNRPAWASFDTTSGTLSGTPQSSDLGSFSGVVITVSDGQASASLPPFSLLVASSSVDSDGDGVIDAQDAFPNDPNETLDTDLDGIGNNADSDDDNDGVIDQQDGYPLDAGSSQWVILAAADAGGYIIPAGSIGLDYGASLTVTTAPKQGYQLTALLVDGAAINPVDSYTFTAITAHHTIEARFAATADGLAPPANDPGLPGVQRTDGGSDADNLIDGIPSNELSYRFATVLRDPQQGNELDVFLVLDGYAFGMQRIAGDPALGANYAIDLPLGPAPHAYHFEARKTVGSVVWRWPQQGELDGPVISLLAGRNLIGPATAPSATSTGLAQLLGREVLRWNSGGPSTDINHGTFTPLGAGEHLAPGQGFLVKASGGELLPESALWHEPDADQTLITLQPGWNLIANPYRGYVRLGDLQLLRGGDAAVSWRLAADARWLIDGLFRYRGDASGDYAFSSTAAQPDTVMAPGLGYWIYLAADDNDYNLLIRRPDR